MARKLTISSNWITRAQRVSKFLINAPDLSAEDKLLCQMFVLSCGFVNSSFSSEEIKRLYAGQRQSPFMHLGPGYIRAQNGFVLNLLQKINIESSEKLLKSVLYLQKGMLISEFKRRERFFDHKKVDGECLWQIDENHYGYYHNAKHFIFSYEVTKNADILKSEEELPASLNSLIGHLGARIDSLTAMRILFEKCPEFLVDHESTLWLLPKDVKPMSLLEQIFNPVADVMGPHFDLDVTHYKGVYHYYAVMIQEMYEAANRSRFKSVLVPEILEITATFKESVNDDQIMSVTALMQRVADMMILCPLHDAGLEGVLPRGNLYKQMFGTFAMNGFFKAFDVVQKLAPLAKIQVSIRSYFEWLNQVPEISSSTQWVDSVHEAAEDSDAFFFDLHPNNVVETYQCANHVQTLLVKMSYWSEKPRVLVLDVTLNGLNDPEILMIYEQALPLIEKGLVVIFLQSLTKFSQLGLDKRSGGLLAIYANEDLSSMLDSIPDMQSPDDLTCSYFSYFLQKKWVTPYVSSINQNVQTLYQKILSMAHQQEAMDYDHFQLTLQQDEKACYVALNMKGWVADFPLDAGISSSKCEKQFSILYKGLIAPLFCHEKLPISQRMSIGFTASSVNIVGDCLRLTVGLESDVLLSKYAQVLAYSFFLLNRVSRKGEFMTSRPLSKAVHAYKMIQDEPGQGLSVTKKGDSIVYPCHINTRQGTVIDYSSATQFQKRMVLASLDKLKLTFCHFERICELSSVQLPNVKDSNLHIYGPFETNLGEVDLVLGRDFAFVWQNGIVWDMNSMIYQKGHARLSFSQMTLLDWEDCIENNGYKSVAPFHFFPLDHGWLRFENDQWVLQPDVCFFNEKGIRLFRRTLKDTIRIEVDFWHEKDSFFKRYLMSLFGGLIESYTGIRSKTDKFFAKWTFETLDTRKISLSSVTASCLLLKQSSDLKRSWYEKRRAHCEPVVSDRSESQWQSEEGCWTLSSDDRKFTITKK